MRNVHTEYQGDDHIFNSASRIAKDVARENRMLDPTIVAWHQTSSGEASPPLYEGASPDTWWKKYGEGNGGRLEVDVGEDFQFIMMDARGYEKPGAIPLRSLTDAQGNEYLCLTPLLGKKDAMPTREACTRLDEVAEDQS